MVIRSSIMVAIRGAILNYETSKEYLKKVKSQFTVSSKMYASIIIKRLVTEKYSFDNGVREHILKMSNMASKLKPMDMGLKDDFIVHLLCCPYLRNLRPLILTTTSSLKAGVLRSSLLCAMFSKVFLPRGKAKLP
jgi:hypothetical protein